MADRKSDKATGKAADTKTGKSTVKKVTSVKSQNKTAQSHEHEHEHMNEHEHVNEAGQVHTHTHVLPDGTVITHTHTHTNTKAVVNRLSKAIGHLEAIKKMVEDGRDCSEVLTQLAAVKAAINNTGNVILKDHLTHCIVDAVRDGDTESIEEFNKAIDSFIK